MTRPVRHLVLACALALVTASAQAVGGHFAVDDADTLASGRCKVEGWRAHSPGDARLTVAATGCGVGPFELALSAAHERAAGESLTSWGLSGKWSTEVADGLRLGASVEPGWLARARPRYQGYTARILVSWELGPQLGLHANVGRDIVRGSGDEARLGVAATWQASEHWALVAERYREERGHFFRAGLKWALAEHLELAFSRTQRLSGPGASGWTLAVNREFEGF